MKAFALVALLVGAVATGACGGKTESSPPSASASSASKLTRERAATLIKAKLENPDFGREFSVNQMGLSFAGLDPKTVDLMTTCKLVGVTGLSMASDERTALVEYEFTMGEGKTPYKVEGTLRLYDDGWRVDEVIKRIR